MLEPRRKPQVRNKEEGLGRNKGNKEVKVVKFPRITNGQPTNVWPFPGVKWKFKGNLKRRPIMEERTKWKVKFGMKGLLRNCEKNAGMGMQHATTAKSEIWE